MSNRITIPRWVLALSLAAHLLAAAVLVAGALS